MKTKQRDYNVRIQVNDHDWDETYKEITITGSIENADKVALEV